MSNPTLGTLLATVFGAPEKVTRKTNPIQFWTAVAIGMIGLGFGIGVIYAALV